MKSIRHITRPTTLALLGALALSPAAFAQDASTGTAAGKRFSVAAGYALAEPTRNPQINGTRTQVDGESAPTLSAAYHVNDNIAIEAWGADKFGHRVRTQAGKVASVGAQPAAISGQYRFGAADRTVRPFVGLGYHETNFSEETATPGGALAGNRIGMETAKGAIATAGVDVNLSPSWFARADVRYLQGTSDVKLNGVDAGEAKLEPVIIGVGVGTRF